MLVLNETEIGKAAEVLLKEEVLAFPTETVYGVGVVYDSKLAFDRLVSLKKRPPNKPFALMCSSLEEASSFTCLSPKAKAVMKAFLPGELTLLCKVKPGLPDWVTLGTSVIGIRVPASTFVLDLLKKVGKPCLVTSANRSGEPTSTSFEETLGIFKDEVGGIVEGKCVSMVPTTIVDVSNIDSIKLIRQGTIPFIEVEKVFKNS